MVVNPSLFTPFYDFHFCRALVECGEVVTLVGRPLRDRELPTNRNFEYSDLFYRWAAKRDSNSRPSHFDRIRKGLEHASGSKALVRLVAERSADIVHFQWLLIPFIDRVTLTRLSRRCGLVLTVHNAELVAHDASAAVGHIGAWLQRLDQKRALLGFDRYVVHSYRSFERLIDLGVTPNRIVHLAHPPLELETTVVPLAEPKVGTRRHVLFFGNIKPYKGVDILIDAGIAMAAVRRDFLITIAGRPAQPIDELQKRIANACAADVFRFDLNYISDERLAHYLLETDLVVFPYRDIDGSGALSHAIRFEKPIIASRVGGFAESPFKEHVELVQPGNSNALAETIIGLLDEPARLARLARQSSDLRTALPTWQAFARECQRIYRELRT